ncbi:uncharacterized protein milt isoform X2 [Hetaerina americana]|uniref:uncharacterized protein milt isoform X2 n=1 Tax=Hetaerina americana TaxID=62018 RepID=UPI003A7F5AB4
MKGTVRSNSQTRKQGNQEVSKVKGRENTTSCSDDRTNKSPQRFGNTVPPTKPRQVPEGSHRSGGKTVRPPVTSSPPRRSPKVGRTASPERQKAIANVDADPRVGSPARAQTPKLERHFSFEEEEEGVMVTSTPSRRPAGVPTGKEKPVKPVRKNLPKVGTPPALKRRLNAPPSDGFNAIFTPAGPGGSPGALRRSQGAVSPNQRVETGNGAFGKRATVARDPGDVTRDVAKLGGDVGLLPSSAYPGNRGGAVVPQDGVAASSEFIVCDSISLPEANESGSSAASPDSVKSQLLFFLSEEEEESISRAKLGTIDSTVAEAVAEPNQEPVPNSHNLNSQLPNVYEVKRSRTNGHEISRSHPKIPDDVRLHSEVPEVERTHPNSSEVGRERPNVPEVDRKQQNNLVDYRNDDENSEISRLISQDSGVSFSQSIDANSSRSMHLEANGELSCLSRARVEEIQCCQIPRERFYGEFGDVSDDIGLDRLATLHGARGRSPVWREGTIGYEDPESYVLNNGGHFKLVGEFGDVTDDLGAARFPSRSRDSSLGSTGGFSYGVYEAPGGEGAVQRRARNAPDLPAAPVLDFPGLSADSGLDEVDEDMYEYDEDFAVEDAGTNMDEELILEVLCANRVNQMTRTYNDIEAVSRLLEEKEKDLELTARIGKELLDQNQGLKVRLATLEVELRSAHDENTQLTHELQQKTQLLHALTSDEDGSPHDHASPLVSPSCGTMPPIPAHHLSGRTSARASVELLKRRIAWLEEENKSLRVEATQLAKDTLRVEEEEAKLVEGVKQQLVSASEESRLLSEELERVRNEGGRQRAEVDTMVTKLDSSQLEIKRLRHENEELTSLVMITKENQDRLTTELADFKERYGEVMCLLTEAQENLRKVRQKELPSALAGTRYLAPPITTHHSLQGQYGDSIALELESSLNYGLSLDSGIHMSSEVSPKAPHYRKVFETVRSASRSSGSPSPSPLHQRHPSLGGSSSSFHQSTMVLNSSFAQLSTTATLSSASSSQACRMSTRALSGTQQAPHGGYNPRGSSFSDAPRHLYGGLPSTGFHSLDSTGQSEESDHSEILTDAEDCLYPGTVRDGIPGTPGAKELQAALVRIAKTQQPPLMKGEKAIGGYEGKTREPSLDSGSLPRWSVSSLSSTQQQQQPLPYGCRTPDSIMSTGSSRGSSRSWRMPEKLQIVKPLEGSLTLGWWSRLATPSLSAALEERPGVKVRGGTVEGVTEHTLLDLEEDDSVASSAVGNASEPIHPGKFFQGTGSVYTYTNSTVLHPDNTVPPRLAQKRSDARRDLLSALGFKELRQPRERKRKGSSTANNSEKGNSGNTLLVKSL